MRPRQAPSLEADPPPGLQEGTRASHPHPHRHPCGRRLLTGADDGEFPHVPEQAGDGGAGAGVEPIPADAQVELQPAGVGPERQRRRRGGQVELLPVELVSPGRERFWG